ncbi:MAG: hypothetical protein ACJ798_10860 [Phenylobacterium sp.]
MTPVQTLALALACSAAAAIALPTQAQPKANEPGCFLRSDIRNHTVGDDHTMYFDVGGRGVYRAVMSNSCLASAVSSDPIVMVDRTGSGRICRKIDLDVAVRGTRCIVDRLERLTPEEVAALPKRQRP